jgi:hypothetical protein
MSYWRKKLDKRDREKETKPYLSLSLSLSLSSPSDYEILERGNTFARRCSYC